MPTCKKCGNRIEKFHKDRCPICGQVRPFEGFDSNATVEITTEIDVDNLDYKPRKKSTLLILFITLGFFGIPFFYIHQKKMGILYMLINVVGIALISFILAFYGHFEIFASVLIAIGALLLVNVGVGLFYYNTKNLQDGKGDFVV